ncbi:hypothetical protein L484_023919 [Morus notabilis]|uniref:Uncharacterized protein n=1 Tax=Morus notabilis TaxID=981085 RepID=W9R0L1_9ROSA|nr:hypothetical protein L484_023919 [Morus notabilis]
MTKSYECFSPFAFSGSVSKEYARKLPLEHGGCSSKFKRGLMECPSIHAKWREKGKQKSL